jgi:hypothetical protein
MKRLFAIALSLASSGAMACPAGYYTNVDGYCVQRPTYYAPPAYTPPPTYAPPRPYMAPDMPSARCRDGIYSYSLHRSGTCSHHGGIGY